jgi:hypothetical protein
VHREYHLRFYFGQVYFGDHMKQYLPLGWIEGGYQGGRSLIRLPCDTPHMPPHVLTRLPRKEKIRSKGPSEKVFDQGLIGFGHLRLAYYVWYLLKDHLKVLLKVLLSRDQARNIFKK